MNRLRSVFSLAVFMSCALCGAACAAEAAPAPDFGALSLLPPLAAIGLCLLTREVIPALFVGSWIAGTMVSGWNPVSGFGLAVENIWNGLGDPWGARIVLTCIAMSGLVGVMQVGGGVKAAIRALSRKITGSRSAMFFTELAGFTIFFEDYVNAAVVGTTMAPITDRYRISKEKLSYLVDSTAAPIACIAGISSWVAYMVGQIGKQYTELGITASPYTTYLQSIPYVFYSLIALGLLTFLVLTSRDFGPMLEAERRARLQGKLLRDGATPLSSSEDDPALRPDDTTPLRVINFVLPVLFLIGAIVAMLLVTGGYPQVGLGEAMGNADSSRSLVYGSFAAATMTIIFYALQGLTSLSRLFRGFLKGAQAIFVGTLILIFAWGISSAIKSVGTAGFVVSVTKDFLSPNWIPMLTFFVGMIISFCTGTSYGTMGILMPIVVPLIMKVCAAEGIDPQPFLLPTIGAVFAGAVWGDHCSPISDTSIMSSMFSGSDHIDHVKTQMPYAILAAVGSAVAYGCIAFGVSHWLALGAGFVVTLVIFMVLSKKVEEYTPEN
ncbi:MAG: Na+/H+ antiporter NhaC family protein [Pyramidobacter sp.]|nr:Na+/H+ antiporter NhaC family protein [Pyramidobacter sp.]